MHIERKKEDASFILKTESCCHCILFCTASPGFVADFVGMHEAWANKVFMECHLGSVIQDNSA